MNKQVPNKLRRTFFDIEVSPASTMTYGKFHEATILEVIRSPYIFCFSYADVDTGKVKSVSLPDFPLYKREPYNDREVVKRLYKVISESDQIIAHNIAFDMRTAVARFIYHKLPPIKPVKTICTLKMARRVGQFPANTLKEVAIYLGVKHKMETSKNLWQDIHFRKDKKAWREMCLYNKIDTEVGIEIFKVLRGWTGKPHKDDMGISCECGSKDFNFRGYTLDRKRRHVVCKTCLRWFMVKA